jgi:hypothetical protein
LYGLLKYPSLGRQETDSFVNTDIQRLFEAFSCVLLRQCAACRFSYNGFGFFQYIANLGMRKLRNGERRKQQE